MFNGGVWVFEVVIGECVYYGGFFGDFVGFDVMYGVIDGCGGSGFIENIFFFGE